MIINLILLSIALAALIIGTITDIKTKEVPDWLNYSVIFAAVGIRAIYSAFTFDWMFLISGLIGMAIFVGIAYAMFYTGQWGGGDSKMLMGLGALIGLQLRLDSLLVSFFVNALFIGAIYGLIYSLVLAFSNRKKFLKEWRKIFSKKILLRVRRLLLIISLFLVIVLFFSKDYLLRLLLLILVLIILFGFYVYIFVKVVENSCMFKYVKPMKLTEGDWIAKDVKVNGKYITGPKDLGIEKKQIRALVKFYRKGKVKKILVKYGIPFVPSFLVAFIISLIFGNLIFVFI